MADLAQSHPQLALRFEAVVEQCRQRGWSVGITSSTRSRAVQADLYDRWLRGRYNAPSVANPNSDGGVSPWGWRWRGSYHMPQQDGHSHALDLHWGGCTSDEFNAVAESCGLRRTVRNEPWHYQWVHRKAIFEAPALLSSVAARRKGRGMFIWTTDYPDGTSVHYMWTGRHVISLHALDVIAWNATVGGHVPHFGHVPPETHDVLLSRLAGAADPRTGAIGAWGHA